MAITSADYALFTMLKKRGVLSQRCSVLELGESNWYGDMEDTRLIDDVFRTVSLEDIQTIKTSLEEAKEVSHYQYMRFLGKVFWKVFLDPSSMTAIDLSEAGPAALKLNLNEPVSLGKQFDVVLNLGTIEHIFDIARCFRTVHDHCTLGGLMVHQSPWQGWHDHGFYSIHPTLYWDLAYANGYEVVEMLYAELDPPRTVSLLSRTTTSVVATENIEHPSMVVVALRKTKDAPFAVPMQGVYNKAVREEHKELVSHWRKMRA